ncbi:hypothetical protein ANN_28102, partial [Periplaneta americana]
MADLCEGGSEPPGFVKAISRLIGLFTLRLLSPAAWPPLLYTHTDAPGPGPSVPAYPLPPAQHHAATAAAPLRRGHNMLLSALQSSGLHQARWAAPQLSAAAHKLQGAHCMQSYVEQCGQMVLPSHPAAPRQPAAPCTH